MTMKKIIPAFFLLVLMSMGFSQGRKNPPPAPVVSVAPSLTKADLRKMNLFQDTLHQLSNTIVYDTILATRRKACYTFIPKFVEALKINNSFYYPFDSFETISKIYPPDSSFRIFTWQMALPHGHFRYYGVIQMRSSKLKIFPLFDARDTLPYQAQVITGNSAWYGCLYYNVIEKQVNNKPVYTLFGFEAADVITRRKVVDILQFDANGQPKFGAPLFCFKYDDSTRTKTLDTLTRFFIEYNYNAPTVLNYDPELQMIVFDHVAPPNEKAKGATFSYVPDGTYEGFLWINNHWQWVEKVFTFAINENDNPPIPTPLFGEPKRQPVLPKDGDPR
jgi:hypothetical protein